MLKQTSVEYVVDCVNVQVVVAKMEDGHKVAEQSFNPVKLLYPFDLPTICEQAVNQYAAQDEQANASS